MLHRRFFELFKQHWVLGLFLLCLAFSTPLFFRPVFYGFDSFYYLNNVCHGFDLVAHEPVLSRFVFSLLPCNMFLLKSLVFVCMFVSCYLVSRLGERIVPVDGWLAGFFVFASPVWTTFFWKFENDTVAFPIIMLSALLFYSGCIENNNAKRIIALACLFIAQMLWESSIIWLIAFSFSVFWLFIPITISLAIKFQEFIQKIAPVFNGATENLPALGLLYQMFLIQSLMFLKYTPTILAPITFFSSMTLINSKFAIHTTPLLAITATAILKHPKANTYERALVPIGVVFLLFYSIMSGPSFPPGSQELSAVELAVTKAGNSQICNDWGVGHMIEYYGGNALAKAGGEQLCQGCKNCIILSYRDFNCTITNNAAKNELKVYQC